MDYQDWKIEVTVLRGSCADDETCPAITDVGDPGVWYFVAEPASTGRFRLPTSFVPEIPASDDWAYLSGELCTDRVIVKAHVGRIAAHERLYRVPLDQIPCALRLAVTSR
jgi:hypothetical protein